MSIPKKIHYCWFGGKEKPDKIKEYIKTWKKNTDFEIIEWNETNFNIEKYPFVKFAYKYKNWAFVSDYVRLKVLQEYGGIYLDTDVEIRKNFEELLGNKMILSFIFDSSIGTAVIGAEPNHEIINKLIELYDTANFEYLDNRIKIKFKGYEEYQTNNNNDLFTIFFIKNVKNFKLVNKNQQLENVTIFKKEYFERKTFSKKIDYSVHHCYGSWYKDDPDKRSNIAKMINTFMGDVLYDKLQCYLKNSKLPYYKIHINDKLNE